MTIMRKVLVRLRKRAQERIFGKNTETTIVALDWALEEEVMLVNTRNKSYVNKGKGNIPKTTFAPSSSSQNTNPQVVTTTQSQETSVSFPSSKYNILNQLASIKVDASLLDMVIVPEQQQHLKNYMEGKTSHVASISEELGEDEPHVNRIGVNNFRNPVKNPPFYISVKIMDRIAHCCLIDGRSGPSVMSKIIMEELGLSCTNENVRSMLSYNNQQQSTMVRSKM
jgi:hypothetical protein